MLAYLQISHRRIIRPVSTYIEYTEGQNSTLVKGARWFHGYNFLALLSSNSGSHCVSEATEGADMKIITIDDSHPGHYSDSHRRVLQLHTFAPSMQQCGSFRTPECTHFAEKEISCPLFHHNVKNLFISA